jgi:hypothetical protein
MQLMKVYIITYFFIGLKDVCHLCSNNCEPLVVELLNVNIMQSEKLSTLREMTSR